MEVLTWLGAVREGAERLAEVAAAGWTFEDIGDAWLDGVEEGHIGPAARARQRGNDLAHDLGLADPEHHANALRRPEREVKARDGA